MITLNKKRVAPAKETTLLSKSIAQSVPEKENQTNLTSHYKRYRWAGRLLVMKAVDLRQRALDGNYEINFLPLLGQQGYIPEGRSVLISAYPKTGKTELMTDLVIEWANLGKAVHIISEESEATWGQRLRKKTESLENIFISCALGVSVEDLKKAITKDSPPIVIIDTIRNFLNLHDENSNSEVARAINPFIQRARNQGKTIIFLHHTRKGGGEHGEGASGAHAFLGSVDVTLEIYRLKSEQQRIIRGAGRVVEIKELVYELNESSHILIALGSPKETQLATVCERVLSQGITTTWLKASDIQTLLNEPKPSKEQLRIALNQLAEEGKITRKPAIEEGKKGGATYQWRLAEPKENP